MASVAMVEGGCPLPSIMGVSFLVSGYVLIVIIVFSFIAFVLTDTDEVDDDCDDETASGWLSKVMSCGDDVSGVVIAVLVPPSFVATGTVCGCWRN